jgi:uncharacterized damage-inducible protein DinB
MTHDPLRTHVTRLLDWHDAHATFDDAVEGIAPELYGKQPDGLPYSPWQLLEHLRLTQLDILEFCRDSSYKEKNWPEEYWPETEGPSSADAWEKSVADYRSDREELKRMAADTGLDLFARIPHGSGQTYLREFLLVADHNAYHVGQLVVVRRLLGAWPS